MGRTTGGSGSRPGGSSSSSHGGGTHRSGSSTTNRSSSVNRPIRPAGSPSRPSRPAGSSNRPSRPAGPSGRPSRPQGPRPGYSSGYRPGYNRPVPPPPPPRPGYRRTHYSSSRPVRRSTGGGCSTAALLPVIIFLFVLVVIFAGIGACSGNKKGSISDDVVNNAAEKFYDKHYGKREDIMIFYVAYSEVLDSEIQCIKFGSNSEVVVGSSFDALFDLYDLYYQDDVGLQISSALADYTSQYIGDTKIKSEKKFDSKMIFDDLNWIDSTSSLQGTAKDFYNKTGIQFSVAVVDYDKLPGAKTKSNAYKVVIALIIVIAILIVVKLVLDWKKKKKELELKELEEQQKILNTPLETFSGVEALARKYDDASGGKSGASTNKYDALENNNNSGMSDLLK
ncbi:MAG: hypothetical protein K5848_07470 [Lachnospiraceae bacterium]|nr:hypothetical protein [Lachnospiraceae bacterium]